MSEEEIRKNLVKICGSKYVSNDLGLLESYSKDLSFMIGKIPRFIVWPRKAKHVEKILKLANLLEFSVIPVSSSSTLRYHGDTIPQRDNSVIVDLSKMNKILSIDRKNRVIMVEPGVVFGQLIPILQKKGLRVLLPLHPRNGKSVLTAALERVPVTIPRYQWDSSDPLLCTEVIFGTGDVFRTGAAAGPGTLKQQKKSGQAQANPMGPTQFSPFRLIQGAQGSLGIVTWATLKLELMPTFQKVFHLQSDNIQDLLILQQLLVKYRLTNEMLILNNINLACLLRQLPEDIKELSKELSRWNLIYILGGRGELANDKTSYQEGDIDDIITDLKLNNLKKESSITNREIINTLNSSTSHPWRRRLRGSFQDIFFITNFENIIEYINLMENEIPENLGIYLQAINQGTSYHCEFDIYYDQEDKNAVEDIKAKYMNLSVKLMNMGAFFNRPYGLWAKEVFKRHQDSTQSALKKVKKIFDPKNILNPGVLCFDS
ncbi:MAG: FAD-binding oxidoreductase [Candidatus Lokiarchaeota archaeon]|nr:FAD-binding oxidoreductase [Candidatus Lokiarchaeota archaeon]